MTGFSVVILTLNEEANLPQCFASIQGCSDIVVLDSGSRDRTVTIAREAGARVFTNAFQSFARQRNHAQRMINFAHPWVFHLDADERFTPELAAACHRESARTDVDGFYVAPRMFWRGRWIPRCTDYPAWQARFVRAPDFVFVDVGHGQREDPRMRMAYVKAGYVHDLSAGGPEAWLAKHRHYARAEAGLVVDASTAPPRRAMFSPNGLIRRRALKRLSYRLPFRPTLRFLYQYFWRRGFLDGREGLEYCRLLARYEGFADDEIRRLRATPRPA